MHSALVAGPPRLAGGMKSAVSSRTKFTSMFYWPRVEMKFRKLLRLVVDFSMHINSMELMLGGDYTLHVWRKEAFPAPASVR